MTHMALHAVLLINIKIGMKAVHDSASHAEKNCTAWHTAAQGAGLKKGRKNEERDIAMLIDHTQSPCRGKNT